MEFGQFCPIAKATEIIGEKWTILILREILMGSTRFSELQRGLSLISPAVLTKRLNTLSDYELIIKRKIPGQRGHEYFPTDAAQELLPIFIALGDWGMRWTRQNLTNLDYDVDFFMLYLQRSIRPEKLPGKETIIQFHFTNIKDHPYWWIVVKGNDVEVCTISTGKEVDVYFTSTVKCLSDIWMGESSYKKATKAGELKIVGPTVLIRDVSVWMENCLFSQGSSV